MKRREYPEQMDHTINHDVVPDADIPDAVRETGVDPVDRVVEGSVASAAADAVDQLLGEVEG